MYYNISDPHQFRLTVTFTDKTKAAEIAPDHLRLCLENYDCAKDILCFQRNMVFMGAPLNIPEASIVYLGTDAKELYNRQKGRDELVFYKDFKPVIIPAATETILVFQEHNKNFLAKSSSHIDDNNNWAHDPFKLDSFYMTTLIKDKNIPTLKTTDWYGMQDIIHMQSLEKLAPVLKNKPYGPALLNQVSDYNARNAKAYRFFYS